MTEAEEIAQDVIALYDMDDRSFTATELIREMLIAAAIAGGAAHERMSFAPEEE